MKEDRRTVRVNTLILRTVRELQGRSMTSVGRSVGVSRQYISMIEAGERRPSRDLFDALVETLGVDPAVLLAQPETAVSAAA